MKIVLDSNILFSALISGKELYVDIFKSVVEYIDDTNREKYEKDYQDAETGVMVVPVFVETGN